MQFKRNKHVAVLGKRRKGRIALALAILAALYVFIVFADDVYGFQSTLLLIPAFIFLIFAVRRPRFDTNPKGRHGLLNTQPRPPLSLKERGFYNSLLKEAAVQSRFLRTVSNGKPRAISDFWKLEVMRLTILWHQGPDRPPSDDETRSIGLLSRVTEYDEHRNLKPIHADDAEMIGDWETVNALRDRVKEFVDAEKAMKKKREAWEARVGNRDATHLIKDGWIPFLQSFEKPDVKLWHNVVNIFHDLYGDQLDAAFWILAQPACDKATVYGFMTGYIGYEDLCSRLEDASRKGASLVEAARPFVQVVNRWNDGFYKWHSIAYDEENETPNEHLADGTALNDQLAELSERFGIDLPLIKNIDFDPTAPIDHLSRSQKSAYAIHDGEGLHLAYPNL